MFPFYSFKTHTRRISKTSSAGREPA